MKKIAHTIDTNVLIIASSASNASPFPSDNTPIKEPELRQRVLNWLIEFETNHDSVIILDINWNICGEYQNKMNNQDYGLSIVMNKIDQDKVIWVNIKSDNDGHAELPEDLSNLIADRADRKFVAAALAGQDSGLSCTIINASDTDWLDCTHALGERGILVEHLLEDWLRSIWKKKQTKTLA